LTAALMLFSRHFSIESKLRKNQKLIDAVEEITVQATVILSEEASGINLNT
jgi:hypothetical protein